MKQVVSLLALWRCLLWCGQPCEAGDADPQVAVRFSRTRDDGILARP
jgi:hypothetical protein